MGAGAPPFCISCVGGQPWCTVGGDELGMYITGRGGRCGSPETLKIASFVAVYPFAFREESEAVLAWESLLWERMKGQ